MILIDTSVGSKELAPLFRPFGIDVEVMKMEFGDLAFVGKGSDGAVSVGVERKKVSEFLDALDSGRLDGHQAPGMASAYDIRFLILEGQWRRGEGGWVESPNKWHGWRALTRGKRMAKWTEITNFCLMLELVYGMHLICTRDAGETVAWVAGAYRCLEKEWGEHKTGKTVYTPKLTMLRPRFAVKAAAQLRGVGAEKAVGVARHFGSARRMANADTAAWMKALGIKGRESKVVDSIVREWQEGA